MLSIGCHETSVATTNQRCVTLHKNEDLIYMGAVSCEHAL